MLFVYYKLKKKKKKKGVSWFSKLKAILRPKLPSSPSDEVNRSSSIFTRAPIMIAAAAAASSSSTWLRAHRIRYLFLFLCLPILLPFLCASFPFICAAEVCLRICRRNRRKIGEDSPEDERLRRCEEGCCVAGDSAAAVERERDEIGLLQRYLEDQLLLVGSVYECGDDDELDGELGISDFPVLRRSDCDDTRTPLLV